MHIFCLGTSLLVSVYLVITNSESCSAASVNHCASWYERLNKRQKITNIYFSFLHLAAPVYHFVNNKTNSTEVKY